MDINDLINGGTGKQFPNTSIASTKNSISNANQTLIAGSSLRTTNLDGTINDPMTGTTYPSPESDEFHKNKLAEQNAVTEGSIKDTITNPLSEFYTKNLLNRYNNMSYIISMFAVPRAEYIEYSNHKKLIRDSDDARIETLSIDTYCGDDKKVIIAETAETASYQINVLDFESMSGANQRSGMTPIANGAMTITEASGASLIDKIIALATNLGWGTHQDMPFFLDVKFIGEDDNGLMREIDEHGNYRWEIKITDMTPELNHDCTKYDVSFGQIDDMGSDVGHFNTLNSIQIRKNETKTLGQAITQLETHINKQNTIYMNKDWIKYFTSDKQYELKYLKNADNKQGIESFKNRIIDWTDEIESTGIVIPASTSIQSALNILFSSTLAPETDESDVSFPRIEPKVYFRGFDENTKEKIFEIDFLINTDFKITRAVINASNIEWMDDLEKYKKKQKSIFNIINKSHQLKKHYFFTFSEQNENVIDADFQTTFNWQLGLSAPKIKVVDGAAGQINASKNRTVSEEKEQEFVENQKTYKDLTTRRDELLTESGGVRSKEIILLDKIISQTETKLANKKTDMYGREDINLNTFSDTSNTRTSKKNKTTKRTFLDDVVKINTNGDWGKRVQVVRAIDKYSIVPSQGGLKETTKGTSYIKMKAYKNIQEKGGFQTIDLTIKGDPYWFGESLKQITVPNTLKKKAGDTNFFWDWHANYGQGEMCMYFSTKTPGKRNGIGNYDYDESYTINTIYSIHSVAHTFSEGKFTQVITGTYNNLFDFLQQ